MFKVVLTNGKEDLSLYFRVRDTDIAQRWFIELQKNYPLYETNRFSNWGRQNFVNDLNRCIDVINSYDNFIDIRATDVTNQKDLNYLHKFFEDARGEVVEETPWFKDAPDIVKQAVQDFNILIHHLEAELRTKGKHPTLVVTFADRPRFELTDQDCKHFTYRWQSGAVYIDYCQVGKTVLDVFKDKDTITEAVRPQTHYSADFMVKFGPSTPWWMYYPRVLLIKLWLRTKQFSFKNLNIGMIPVADLTSTVDKETLIKFNQVKLSLKIKI